MSVNDMETTSIFQYIFFDIININDEFKTEICITQNKMCLLKVQFRDNTHFSIKLVIYIYNEKKMYTVEQHIQMTF